MATVNVTVGMTPEMLEDVDEAAESNDMSRSQYIRHCIRQAEDSPFDVPESLEDADGEDGAVQEGVA